LLRALHAGIVLVLATATPARAQDAAAKSHEARQMLAERRFDDAIRLYRELIAAQPANPGWKLNLGVAQHMAEHDKEAVATLGEVLRIKPDHGPALVMSGGSYIRLGQPARAVDLLERAARLMPDDMEVTRMLADAASMSGRFTAAAAALRKLAAAGGDAPAWSRLGRTYEALAEDAFEKLEQRAPGSAHWLALVAETRMKQGRSGAALSLLRQALAKSNRRDWKELVAALYEQAGHADWATAERAAAARLPAPTCAAPSAECQFKAKRYVAAAGAPGQTAEDFYWRAKAYNELAREAFEQLSKFPDSADWRAFLAGLHRNRGKYDDSIQEWRSALAIQPGDAGLERELAGTLLAARRYEEAESTVRGLVLKSPGDGELQWILGESLVAQQKHSDALQPLSEAVRLDPKRLAARASLGRALQATGSHAAAIPHLQAALASDRDGAVHFQLSRSLAAVGRNTEAAALARKSQELRVAGAEAGETAITPP
ncbi:MAG: tetratricopeptide repeat protein, partial [Acidobacteria bacterium]|nr:tetratricopeptide repeat protein [Acidobacteriota bacterium]